MATSLSPLLPVPWGNANKQTDLDAEQDPDQNANREPNFAKQGANQPVKLSALFLPEFEIDRFAFRVFSPTFSFLCFAVYTLL